MRGCGGRSIRLRGLEDDKARGYRNGERWPSGQNGVSGLNQRLTDRAIGRIIVVLPLLLMLAGDGQMDMRTGNQGLERERRQYQRRPEPMPMQNPHHERTLVGSARGCQGANRHCAAPKGI